jgi:phytoene dehydrogenase-like protein
MEKKIAIIGAGIAGLSAGCYGRMNGYDTEIFEMHTIPGGVCTGWVRKGYTFDGCLHWLTGSAPGNPNYQIWEELGALKGKKIINHEAFCHVITASGTRFIQYGNLDRLADEFKKIAPEDSAQIDRIRTDARRFGTLRMPISAPRRMNVLKKLKGLMKVAPYIPLFRHYGGMSAEKLAAGFKNPQLREVFSLIIPLPDFPAFWVLGLFSLLDKQEAGWPEGGSLALARSIARRYTDLGGKIHYGARVEEILVENDRAVGVRLADGSEHRADVVISAADGHATLFSMLKGKYVSEQMKKSYDSLPLYTPFVQVSFGVNRDMSGEPRLTTFKLPTPMRVAGMQVPWLFLNNYGFDPTMAPKGKSAITVLFWAPFDYWEKLHQDKAKYQEEKKRVEQDILTWLESIYPGIGEAIEVTDVATPMTWVRYTGNWRASYEGWRPIPATMRVEFEKTLPGLKGFSMIGQWTRPMAGLPTSAQDGRVVIELLCREDQKPFITTKP